MNKPILFCLLIILLPLYLHAQSNPFLSSSSGSSESQKSSVTEIKTQSPWLQKSSAIQKNLQKQISSALKGENGRKDTLLFLGLSFLYGALHALGPGHRKTVLFSYFIGEDARPATGILAGLLLAITHAGSAVLLVGGAVWFTTRSLLLSVNQAEVYLYPLTYGIILILGIWMIFHGIADFRHRKQNHNEQTRGLPGMILSGMVPCPAASAIIIFAFATGTILPGILAVLAMSLGMGILLAGIGLAAVLFRTRIIRLIKGKKPAGNRGTALLELGLHTTGGIFLTAFGALFLIQTLY